jgi:hypothetical protein
VPLRNEARNDRSETKRPAIRSMPTAATSYKVEKWRRDGMRVELMLYAGNDLDKARHVFEPFVEARNALGHSRKSVPV